MGPPGRGPRHGAPFLVTLKGNTCPTVSKLLFACPLSAEGELDGYLSYQDDPGPDAVLYVHGFGSTRGGIKAGALEAACARHGWPFAAFDFRGHGRSGGSLLDLRATGLLADLAAVADHLATRGIRRLFPVGSSMGGWAASWFALERGTETVPAVGLVAPAFRFMRRRWETLSPRGAGGVAADRPAPRA